MIRFPNPITRTQTSDTVKFLAFLWTNGSDLQDRKTCTQLLLDIIMFTMCPLWCSKHPQHPKTCTQSFSYLVGALSPVSHKGLHQGWTQASLCLQVIHFTSHHTTNHVFLAYLYSAGSQHGNLHPAGWPILFCGPTLKPVVATANTGKKSREVLKKMQVNGPEG